MEPCLGGNLEHLFERLKANDQWFSYRQVVTYLGQMVIAVEHLQRCHVISRDIKAANFVLDHEGNLKMVDFGLGAHLADTPLHRLSAQTNLFAGDLYDMGRLLRQLCTGEMGDSNDSAQPTPVLSRQLNDLIDKLTSDDPKKSKKRNENIRMDCFAKIWEHPAFRRESLPFQALRFDDFRAYLTSDDVQHDRDIMMIVKANVEETLKDAPLYVRETFHVTVPPKTVPPREVESSESLDEKWENYPMTGEARRRLAAQ